MDAISSVELAAKRGAIATGYLDRMHIAPSCELQNVRMRMQFHAILARRPELSPVLESAINHPQFSNLIRNIK